VGLGGVSPSMVVVFFQANWPEISAYMPLGADSSVIRLSKAYFGLIRYYEMILCYFQGRI